MATPSPPKPWERAGNGSISSPIVSAGAGSAATPTISSATTSSGAPALPSRPETLNSVVDRTAAGFSSPYGANRSYNSPYSGGYGGGMSSYSSPYSRLGGMGGMGGYGGGYGGMGSMGGYGGMNGGMYGSGYGQMGGMGMGMGPGQDQSLTQSFGNSTQATFQMIESIVGAFGGFAQMLESTYMATHSSFFAMVSVAEQFGNLRQTFGSVLGIYTILRWFRTAMAKLTGRPPPASSTDLTPLNFAKFSGKPLPDGSTPPPRASKKPFFMFLVAVFGLPYLMGKLIRALARSQEEQERKRLEANPQSYPGQDGQPLDPSKLDFCRVMYDFVPEANAQSVQGVDLAVTKGDLVAVLSKTDPLGNASEWWLCRARDGRKGYLPAPYLETIQRKPQQQITSGGQSDSPAGSRAQTMTTNNDSSEGSRSNTMVDREKELVMAANKKPPQILGKAGDLSVESFQKGMFHS